MTTSESKHERVIGHLPTTLVSGGNGGARPADVAAPTRQLSARQQNVSLLLAEVIGVDLVSRTVEIKYPGAVPFLSHSVLPMGAL